MKIKTTDFKIEMLGGEMGSYKEPKHAPRFSEDANRQLWARRTK